MDRNQLLDLLASGPVIAAVKDADGLTAALESDVSVIFLLSGDILTIADAAARVRRAGKRVFVPACKLGGVIETTGAGDTFCACVLNYVLEHGLDGLTLNDLTEMLHFANTAAYLVTTKKGAIRSMPEYEQIKSVSSV